MNPAQEDRAVIQCAALVPFLKIPLLSGIHKPEFRCPEKKPRDSAQ
jgi:hypothetical protein